MIFENIPYTNFHDLNLDWIINTVKQMRADIDNGLKTIDEAKAEIEQTLAELDGEIAEKVEQAISDAIESGEFAEIIASVANENIYYCVNPTMSQAFIQNIINTHTAVKFTPGTYNVYIPEERDCGYEIPSNRIIFFDNAVVKKIGAYDHEYDEIFRIYSVENVWMYGNGTIDYNRAFMQLDTGEHGMCLSIGGSSHITIEGLKFINAFGDGIYLNNNQYVYINNVFCDNNRRNAISIVSGKYYNIKNSYFMRSNGTAPQAGICIETNTSTDVLQNINISDCVSEGNLAENPVYITVYSSNANITLRNIKAEAPVPIYVTGDYCVFRIEDCDFKVKETSHIFNFRSHDTDFKDNNEFYFTRCNYEGNGVTTSGAFFRYAGNTLRNIFIDDCWLHNITVNGRAVLALGTLENVNNIHIKCRSHNLAFANPVTLFRSTIIGPVIEWSINNDDERLIDTDGMLPVLDNYRLTSETPLAIALMGVNRRKLRIANRTNTNKVITRTQVYSPAGSGAAITVGPNMFVVLDSFANGYYVNYYTPVS